MDDFKNSPGLWAVIISATVAAIGGLMRWLLSRFIKQFDNRIETVELKLE